MNTVDEYQNINDKEKTNIANADKAEEQLLTGEKIRRKYFQVKMVMCYAISI